VAVWSHGVDGDAGGSHDGRCSWPVRLVRDRARLAGTWPVAAVAARSPVAVVEGGAARSCKMLIASPGGHAYLSPLRRPASGTANGGGAVTWPKRCPSRRARRFGGRASPGPVEGYRHRCVVGVVVARRCSFYSAQFVGTVQTLEPATIVPRCGGVAGRQRITSAEWALAAVRPPDRRWTARRVPAGWSRLVYEDHRTCRHSAAAIRGHPGGRRDLSQRGSVRRGPAPSTAGRPTRDRMALTAFAGARPWVLTVAPIPGASSCPIPIRTDRPHLIHRAGRQRDDLHRWLPDRQKKTALPAFVRPAALPRRQLPHMAVTQGALNTSPTPSGCTTNGYNNLRQLSPDITQFRPPEAHEAGGPPSCAGRQSAGVGPTGLPPSVRSGPPDARRGAASRPSWVLHSEMHPLGAYHHPQARQRIGSPCTHPPHHVMSRRR